MKNNRGTTLLELMVSVAIFSSIMLVVTGVFANVNTAQREVVASQNIQESVRFFMEVMSKEIRMALGDWDGLDELSCTDPLNLVNTDRKTFNHHTGDKDVLYFVNKDGECVYYILDDVNKEIQISRDDGSNFFSITPGEIEVSNLRFFVDDNEADDVRTLQSRVTISFDVAAESGIDMHTNKIKMQTTISSRRYE